jgi:hypothetical protein
VLVWGTPGAGKTTLAAQLWDAVAFQTLEQSPDQIVALLKRLDRRVGRVRVPTWTEDQGWDLGLPPDWSGAIVLDSVTEAGDERQQLELFAALRSASARAGAPAVAIAHATKAGASWGSARLIHAVDVVIGLSHAGGSRVATATKHRFGPLGSVRYELTPRGGELVKLQGYYSVEGHAPAYRLEMWPSPSAQWADPYRQAEGDKALRAKLGASGVALAARRTAFAESGFSEPPDVEERKSYAAEHGLRWWSP